jgi:hypothetical protein
MKMLIGFLSCIYASCVRFYPTDFRLAFEEEMCEVFTKAISESKEHHFRDMLIFVFREFRDLPKNLIREHWSQLEEWIHGVPFRKLQQNSINLSGQMDRSHWMNMLESHEVLNFPNKRQRLLSALPLFLFGLGISLTSLTYGGPWYSVPTWRLILSLAIGLLPMAVIAIVGLIALIRRIPDWGITWVGCAFMGFIVFVKTLAEELAESGQRIISEPVEIGIVVILFFAGMALLVIVGMRGWQRGGLLSVGFSVTFTLTFLWAVTAAPFYLHELAVWAGPISLLIAGMTYAYTNGTQLTRFIILVGVGVANYASILLVNTVWYDRFPKRMGSFSPVAFILFMLAFLICGPIMGLITKPIHKTLRRA